MSLSIVRFAEPNQPPRWGVLHEQRVTPLAIPCETTAALIAVGIPALREAAAGQPSLPLEGLTLLSPVTRDGKVLCQGANYRQHMIDSGVDPDAKRFNMFFTKSSASIHDPVGAIVRPRHVTLLDYEVELTLVLGKRTTASVIVTSANLHEYVAGICIGNDVSARCVQIPQMQFHKGKSYRTLCPLGPVLCLLEKDDLPLLDDLRLSLSVNGEVRQNDSTRNLVFKPAETLTEFSQIADFNPGDVLMTGTPSGCALGLPSPAVVRATALLPDPVRFSLFLKAQQRRPQYLKDGDVVEARIVSANGRLDLGVQRHTIVPEK